MKKSVLSMLILSFVSISSLKAFDDNREGFIISLGAGLSFISTDISANYKGVNVGVNDSSNGLATSFKIGYGITDQFLLYYVSNVSWFSYDDDPENYRSGIAGLGMSYYIEEKSPMYITASLGIGSNVDETKSYSGSAFMIGGGYEISPHLQIEGTYLSVNTDLLPNVDLDISSFHLTLNYFWY